MGLGDADLLDDGGGGKAVEAVVACSICLDVVTDDGERSWAKLQCGHKFHLDCIGSAFNTKGAMQCPNCRKIEKGQWLYANGGRQEFSMDDWTHDEGLYNLPYSETPFGVHWCPFSSLNGPPSAFDEGEFSSSAYHDLLGHHAIFSEHALVASTTHPCPYIAYSGPAHPSSSTSSGNISDGSSFSNHWSGLSATSEVPNSYAFPSMDAHYHNWEHSSHFAANNRIGRADQQPIPRPGLHPLIVGHSSATRPPSSITSSLLPPNPAQVTRPHDRHPLQSYFQHSTNVGRTLPVGRRPSSHGGLAQAAPVAASSDHHPGDSYFFSSGRTFQETEAPPRDHFRGWERDQQQQPALLVSQADRESIWGPFYRSGGGSDRPSSFRPSQNGT